MKRILKSISVIILAAMTLAGCAELVELTRGTIEDNVYTNESAELVFTAPEGWRYASDEEIEQIAGNGAEMSGGSRTDFSNNAHIEKFQYDMASIDFSTGKSVVVAYQNLTSVLDGRSSVEEAYFNSLKDSMEKKTLNNKEFSDYTETKIGPDTYKVMSVTDKDYGVTQYFYARRTGNYILIIFVTLPSGEDVDSVMANFS